MDSDNLNIRIITEHGDVIDFEASFEEVEDFKHIIRQAHKADDWGGWLRSEHNDGSIQAVRVDELCCMRIRPYGRGAQFPDSKFVEFTFNGGGYLRAVCESEQALSLEDSLEGNNGILEWSAGAHEILVRTETLLSYKIDEHAEKQQRFDNNNNRRGDYGHNNRYNNNGNGRYNRSRNQRSRVH